MDTEFFESPFEPSRPVSPDSFRGRQDKIIEVLRYMPTVINRGDIHHFFVVGKKGMGKTSFVKYLLNEAEKSFQMIPVYINNDGHSYLEEFVDLLVEKLFDQLKNETWGQKIINTLTNNIEEINLKVAGVKFKKKLFIEEIQHDFSNFLINLSNELKDNKKGIFIVIDDINGLSNDPKFTSWYKSFSETVNVSLEHVPISFTLVSYPDTFDKLADINSSFARMFKLINIDSISDEDIKNFF